MKVRRDVFLAALVVTGACSAAASEAPSSVVRSLDGVGVLPRPASAATDPSAIVAASVAATDPGPTQVVAAAGNRVLVIGDSILASTSSRYSNDMCNALVPLGWRVEVDAETSRFVDFADEVLDRRLSAGWDAVVIGLGSNYGKKEPVFREYLEEAVVRVSPRPVVLVTVTEFHTSRKEVNHAITEIAALHPNVVIADWAAVSRDASLLGNDGLHLTPKGRQRLAETVAATLGVAPAQPGECLKTSFDDDSRGSVEGGPATTVKKGATTTTPKPAGTTKPTPTSAAPKPASTTVPPATVAPVTTSTPPPATPAPSTSAKPSWTVATTAAPTTAAPTPAVAVPTPTPVPNVST